MRPDSRPARVLLRNGRHKRIALRLVRLFLELKRVVWLVREYRKDEIRLNGTVVERGRFDLKTHSIKMLEPLDDTEFKAVFLHEVAHALIYLSKNGMKPTKRELAYGEKLASFLGRSLLPSLVEVKDSATKHLASTYIDELFLLSKGTRTDRHRLIERLAKKAEEILCDLFALYCLTKFRNVGASFRKAFEDLMTSLNLPLVARTA